MMLIWKRRRRRHVNRKGGREGGREGGRGVNTDVIISACSKHD